jgi:hypothetical protein
MIRLTFCLLSTVFVLIGFGREAPAHQELPRHFYIEEARPLHERNRHISFDQARRPASKNWSRH